MYYDVILKSSTSFLDTKFTYQSQDKIEIGSRVVVPFGKADTLTLAFVMGIRDRVEEGITVKSIEEVIDTSPILSKEQIALVQYMVDYNLSDYSSAIQALMPPGGIDKIIEYFSLGINYKILTSEEQDFFEKPRTFDEIKNKYNNKYSKSNIKELVKKQVLFSDFKKNRRASEKYNFYVSLIEDSIKLPAKAKNQQAILDFLMENGETEKTYLLKSTNSNLTSLKALYNKGIIDIRREQEYRNVLSENNGCDFRPVLNDEQRYALDRVLSSDKKFFLIHGITGSGKTEVYMNIIEKYISLGKDAIMLVPEISLTPQTIDRFQKRFGQDIAVLHSKLSISERYDQWNLIRAGRVKIVVGARSAIFAPFENLGIIIIDEEHEQSYKSEKNPKYNAIDIAMERSRLTGAKVVLGTATPSVNTMYKVYRNEIELLRLNNRATNATLPQVEIVDMREELKAENFSMFSNSLREKIEDALKEKKQVILFLNKRGHTSYVFCRSCGYVYKCDACDVSMTYHKYNDRLVCHYCGRTSVKPKTCSNCGSTFIKEFGAGTEKLEEETKMLFPNARIFRMDADTVNNKSDYDRVFQLMTDKKIDILIGTQMLAKGFDFPDVTVVGVMASDLSLNLPDYKASEKTYQLLTQVAGRAGRGSSQGYVVFQTYKPENFAIQAASKNDYYGFFKEELKKRKQFSYPPFQNILIINVASKKRNLAVQHASEIIGKIRSYIRENKLLVEELSGPTPSAIERINNYYRFNVIVKTKRMNELLKVARYIKNNTEKIKDVYVTYSINPDSVY